MFCSVLNCDTRCTFPTLLSKDLYILTMIRIRVKLLTDMGSVSRQQNDQRKILYKNVSGNYKLIIYNLFLKETGELSQYGD
jgi:hypothetical protein